MAKVKRDIETALIVYFVLNPIVWAIICSFIGDAIWAVYTQLIYCVLLSGGIMSFCGGFFIMYTYKTNPQIHSMGLQLIVFMAISDALLGFKFILESSFVFNGNYSILSVDSIWCFVIAHTGQFSVLSSMSWNFVIALNIYLLITKPILHHNNGANLIKYYSIYVWGLSLLTCIIAQAMGKVGISHIGTCWLESGADLAFFYIPLYLYFLFCCYVLYVVWKFENAHQDNSSSGSSGKAAVKMSSSVRRTVFVFTLNFLVGWFYDVVGRLWWDILGEFSPPWLTMADITGLVLTGLINAAVFYVLPFRKQLNREAAKSPKVVGSTNTKFALGKLKSGSQGSSVNTSQK